jgi:quinol monooxygenase YgiN
MYIIIAPIQVKSGAKAQVLEALVPNARGAATTEPGCLRFDVIEDAGDPDRLWVYEVYTDEAAFHAHTQAPHYLAAIETIGSLREQAEGLQGAARGSVNIWPPDSEWKS